MPCFQRGMAVSETKRCYVCFLLGKNRTCRSRGFCGVQWGKTKETTILKHSPYVSWAADSGNVLHSRIHWTACRISRSKVKSKAKMALFLTEIVNVEGRPWCWRSLCSSWDADSEYVVHYLLAWTSCRISRLKVKSKAKMALFGTKIFRDEEQHWCWRSFCSSWNADSEYVVHYLLPWTSCRISRLKVKSNGTFLNQNL